MMTNEVIENISTNITWRLEELREFENIIENLSGDNYEQHIKIILKSMIPMIYSHWEGFITSSMKHVFKYLNTLALNSDMYCYNYLTTAYEETLKSLDDSSGFIKRKKHLVNLYEKFSENIKFGTKIDTKSNLKSNVFEEICIKTNIDFNKFEGYIEDLDMLVNIRNSIAHGDTQSIVFQEYDDVKKYIDLLENLMLDFSQEIQELLENKKYKRGNQNV
jgi:hypothetical protein